VTQKLPQYEKDLKPYDTEASDPAVVRDQTRYRQIMKERSKLAAIDDAGKQ